MAMYQIECAYTCHTGNIRANNEDNFWCFGESLPVNNEGTKGICSKIISGNRAPAMAVFDGMGGESCGEIAAFLASEEFGKFYNTNKRMLRDMRVDKCFIGINGIEPDGGYTTSTFVELTTKQAILDISRQRFILADHTKFGNPSFLRVEELAGRVDCLITDSRLEDFDYSVIEKVTNLEVAE